LEGFVLYVEGPRDRDILRAWAQRLSPALARGIARSAVILGGRQPARATAHFLALVEDGRATHALCVLDRDGIDGPPVPEPPPGLEFFTWGRRHIESYLLVPDAIRRGLRLPLDDARSERSLRALLPDPDDEGALEEVDAKRLLARHGPLARSVGSVSPSRIARVMRPDELHADVHALFERLGEALRLPRGQPLVRFRRET
jgi:hypothetical protein